MFWRVEASFSGLCKLSSTYQPLLPFLREATPTHDVVLVLQTDI